MANPERAHQDGIFCCEPTSCSLSTVDNMKISTRLQSDARVLIPLIGLPLQTLSHDHVIAVVYQMA